MSLVEVIISSTKLDKHNERMTKDALETMAKDVNKYYIPVGIEHDPRIAPVGRVISAEVFKGEDGEYYLKGIIENFAENFEIKSDSEKTMRIDNFSNDGLELHYDRSYKDDLDLLNEINLTINSSVKPQFQNKKALEPLSLLIIGAGVFVIGGIANGFLNKMGSDAWDKVKPLLSQLFNKNKAQEKLFSLNLEVDHNGEKILIDIILTNPTEEDLDKLRLKMNEIDAFITPILSINVNVRKFVIEFKDGLFNSKFIVRKDCIPIKL